MEVVVLGAGIGGMSCAALLAHNGYNVKIIEQSSSFGGKAGQLKEAGYVFDTGPSLLTLPEWIDDLFTRCAKNPRDYFNYSKLSHITRYFYENNKQVDVVENLHETAQNFEQEFGLNRQIFLEYFRLWTQIYDISEETFLKGEIKFNVGFLKSAFTWFKNTGISSVLNSMASYNAAKLNNKEVEKIMNRFATYTGSSPYKTPAFMNQLAVVEMVKGAYFPNGGIYSIPTALHSLCVDLGVQFWFNEKVQKVSENNKGIIIKTTNNSFESKKLISNVDFYTTQKLLGRKVKISSENLSTSAIVFYWGVELTTPFLKLHNIVFSEDYKKEFNDIFKESKIPADPTVYINVSSKKDPTHAPEGCENWFVMINIPPRPSLVNNAEINKARNYIISLIKKKFNINLEDHIVFEEILTPNSLFDKTGAYGGALYGANQNSLRAIMNRKPNQDKRSKNISYVGGSVHPGGGIPLALRSGVNTAEKILKR
jgi:phytoene desaturase